MKITRWPIRNCV